MTSPVLDCFQTKALDELRSGFKFGSRAQLLVGPTGCGKTVKMGAIAASCVALGGEVTALVHRGELRTQMRDVFARFGLDRIGFVAAGEPEDRGAPVQICMIQTLLSRSTDWLKPKLLLCDEAHHLAADEWRTTIERFGDIPRIGFTATPERSDGRGLSGFADRIVVSAQVSDLIASGRLVPCDVIAPHRPTKTLAWDPVDAWFEHAHGRKTVAFCTTVQEAKDLAAKFIERGINAASVDGETPTDEREQTIAAFKRGEILVLTNCFVLTEGFDAPATEVCLLARGCSSPGTYLQMIGRVMRAAPGKDRALVIDLRGAVHQHGLPDDHREYSLDGNEPISGGTGPVRICKACGFASPTGCRVCRNCAAEFPRISQLEMDRCDLVKISKGERELNFFVEHLEIAKTRGYRAGWVAHRFQEKFGRFPRALWKEHVTEAA